MINMTNNTLFRLDNLNKEQIRISYQLSSGKIIDSGSDNTNIFATEIYLEDKISVYTGIKTQIDKTSAQNSNSDSALSEMKKLLEYVKSELLKGLNDTNGASERASIAVQIEGVKENILMLANEQIEGEYLFAGSNTTVKPFSQDPTSGEVTYEGDGYLREVAVEYGSYRDKGVNGFDMMTYAKSTILDTDANPSFSGSDKIVFDETSDRIVDENGNEWKFTEVNGTIDKTKLYKISPDGTNTGDYITMVATTNPDEYISISALGDVDSVFNDGPTPVPPALPGPVTTSTLTNPNFSIIKTANSVSADKNSQIVFNENTDRIIDQDGNEWKFIDPDNTKLYKFNRDGQTEEYLPVLKTRKAGEYVTSTIDKVHLDSGGTKPLTNPKFEVTNNIFDVLDDIIDALKNNDTDKMRDGLEDISASLDSVGSAHADLGARNKVFELSSQRVSSKLTQFNIFYQTVSAADPAKLAVEAKSLELTYISLYSTINRLNELSLINYLK